MRKRLWGVRISTEDGWSLNRFRVSFDGILLMRDEKHLWKVNVFVALESFLPPLGDEKSATPKSNASKTTKSRK